MTHRRRPGVPIAVSPDDGASEKLHKVLARAGLGSRRELEQWISEGRVSVNGRRAHLGARVSARDSLSVDGRAVPRWRLRDGSLRVIAYHKPVGEICSRRDPDGRKSVFDALPRIAPGRWIAVGRLDVNTSGLLLFVSDGELANALMHPSSRIEREYACRIFGRVSPEQIEMLHQGVELEDGVARFDRVIDDGGQGRNHWYRVVVSEGRNRLVRRMWQALDVDVSRLARVRYGPIALSRRVRTGRFESLGAEQCRELYECAGLKATQAITKRSS